MLFTSYNIPEGFGYDFEGMENSTTYEERFDEIMRLMNNHEATYAKVIGYDDEGKTLYLDLGCGITGICKDNWISDNNTYWLNKYLVGHIVNVKINKYDKDDNDYDFVCSRSHMQKDAYEKQKECYKKGTKVLAKVIYHNDKIVIMDIGGGNITYTYASVFRNFDFSTQYVNIEIKNYSEKRSTFWFGLDHKLIKACVISKVGDGYLVSFEDRHAVIKTDDKLEVGQTILIKKKIECKVNFEFHSSFINE